MSLGRLYGSMCLGPVNTAAVCALAYPLGGEFKISHAMSNSILLPFVMQFNPPTCSQRYTEIGRVMGGKSEGTSEATAKAIILAVRELSTRCDIPGIPGDLDPIGIPKTANETVAEAVIEVQLLLNNNLRKINLEDARLLYAAVLALITFVPTFSMWPPL